MTRYIASFVPQAWINDYAVTVDAEGPTEWDCSAYMAALPDDAAREAAQEWDTYPSDNVRNDPAAPAWVRDWSGPFYVIVSEQPRWGLVTGNCIDGTQVVGP